MRTRLVRARANRGHESISRDMLQNGELSFKARGLLAMLLSLPDDWECHGVKGIADRFSKHDGVDAVRTVIQELEEHGYLARKRRPGPGGYMEWLWIYSDTPTDVATEVANWQVSTILGSAKDGEPIDGSAMHGQPEDLEVLQEEIYIREGTLTRSPRAPEREPADAVEVEAIKAERRRKRASTSVRALTQTAHVPASRPILEWFLGTLQHQPTPTVKGRWLCSISELIKSEYPEAVIKNALAECRDQGLGPILLGEVAGRLANKTPKQSLATQRWNEHKQQSLDWFDPETGQFRRKNTQRGMAFDVDPLALPPSTS